MFESFGIVKSAKVITDKETGRSKGFGFVEMEKSEESEAAIQSLNSTEIGGRKVVVNAARPRVSAH
jgi:RNA recognition motif-containing protein